MGFNFRVTTSKQQSEILALIDEGLTPKQIATRRGTSVRAVYKTINKLKNRGFKMGGFNFQGTPSRVKLSKNHIRLHGIEFNIKIISNSDYYRRIQKATPTLNIEGNIIRLYKESLEVYQSKEQFFYGNDASTATRSALDYFKSLFQKIEHRLKILIVKSDSKNIQIVNNHYSEVHNEIAKEANNKRIKIQFKGKDNKIWFQIDDSFNLDEAEFIHPLTAKVDIDRVKRHWDDLRKNDPPNNSELADHLRNHIEITKINTEQLTEVIKIVKGMVKPSTPQYTEIDQSKPEYIG